MSTIADRHSSSEARDRFLEWLDDPFLRVAFTHRHGQWYALAMDFNVASAGDTELAAFRDLAGLVEAYLRDSHDRGRTYQQSVRRVPLALRTWITISSALFSGLPKLIRPKPLPSEARFVIPAASPHHSFSG